MAEAYDAAAVKINGPRYWVLNEITGGGETAQGKIADFGGIEMRLVAKIETKVWEGTVGDALYADNEVQRTTTYLYKASNMVYELTSPEGEVYRMQSYAQLVDPTLTIDDLETVGERLDLPEGWRYEARVFAEDSELIADRLAYVINDDFGNSYQKILGEVAETTAMQGDEGSLLEYHDGYWVTKMDVPDRPIALKVINDMHIDSTTNRATVYAQTRLLGMVVAPPQVGPGECTESPNGETVCFHPNAVYLNGSGKELTDADGSGGWWIKHSWVLGGEGYENCEARPQENYDDCFWVEGELLDDGLSMKVGGTDESAESFYNIRTPLLDENPVRYRVTRFAPKNADPNVGEIDLTPTKQFVLEWRCEEEISAFDNRVRECPTANE